MKSSLWVLAGLACLITFMPFAYAQDNDQSPAGSGVLVSGDDSNLPKEEHNDGDNAPQDKPMDKADTANPPTSPTDDIIVKSTDLVIFQMTANLKLTPDQVNAAKPIVTDYEVKVRDLQLSLQKGNMDSKAMVLQRNLAVEDENNALSHVFSPDQLKLWIEIENE
jgi:hypothetical protein